MRIFSIIVGIWVLIGLQSQVLAQAKPDVETPKVVIKTLPPAYNDQMLRLAEILGSLQYLRDLCATREGMLWREQMENILEKEEPTPKRKAELISRFNRGFRTYQEIYRECTASAVEAVKSYMREGTRLSGGIASRYGR